MNAAIAEVDASLGTRSNPATTPSSMAGPMAGVGAATSKPSSVTGGDGASKGQQFSHRIFDCLVQVEEGLRRVDRSSERSAERCVRILSAAIEQCHSLGGSAGAVAKWLAARQRRRQEVAGAGEAAGRSRFLDSFAVPSMCSAMALHAAFWTFSRETEGETFS